MRWHVYNGKGKRSVLLATLMSESESLASSTHMSSYSVKVTKTPAIKNAPLIGLAEGNGYFSNYHLAGLVIVIPWFVKRLLPLVNRGGFKTYLFLALVLGIPITMAYWTLMSMYGPRKNHKIQLPGRNIEEYITIKDDELKTKYHGKEKIPLQVFHDAFFDDKIDFNGVYSHKSRRNACLMCNCTRRRARDHGAAPRLGQDDIYLHPLQICFHRVGS